MSENSIIKMKQFFQNFTCNFFLPYEYEYAFHIIRTKFYYYQFQTISNDHQMYRYYKYEWI